MELQNLYMIESIDGKFQRCFFQAVSPEEAKSKLLDPCSTEFQESAKIKITPITTLEQAMSLLPEEFMTTGVDF